MCENRSMPQQLEWTQVGSRIRAARTLCRRSQDDIAAQLGVDRTAVMRMEAGSRKVSALELSRLAELFEVPLSYFLTTPPAAVVSRRGPAPDDPDAAARAVWRLDIDLDAHSRDATWLAQEGLLPTPAVPDWPREDMSDLQSARVFAQRVRSSMSAVSGPLGPLADVCAHWGLYVLAVDRDADGASMQLDDAPGFGAAVIGSQLDPGRRRFTAAHELGHHLLKDPYSSDVGVSASRDERERLINGFAQELLLPGADLRAALAEVDETERWATMVRLAADYQVSWSMIVRAAQSYRLISSSESSALAARRPVHGDFLAVLGRAPAPDLALGTTASSWKQAVLTAYRRALITAPRALELLHGAADSVDELPAREVADAAL
jgi:transcriptional regulator with XRE-family HTH domain